MKRFWGTLLVGGSLAIPVVAMAQPASMEWPTYGHDPGGMRFSPLKEIKPTNVDRLKVAWVYHMRPAGAAAPAAAGRGAGGAVGDEAEGAVGGRGRGRGGGGVIPTGGAPLR